MKKLKILPLVLSVVMLVSVFSGCGKAAAEPESKPSAIEVTDMYGKVIRLEKPAERVVALSAGECEIICALGGIDLLVGRGEYCDYPEEIAGIPAISSGSETNVEQIIALHPDVVIMSTMDQPVEVTQAIESAGIQVVSSRERDIECVYQSISVIGAVIGKNAEADALVKEMKASFDAVRVSEPTGKTVYFEVSPLEWGLWTAGSGTFMNEIAELLGLENIFADVEGWAEISEEQVISRNPDYIVTITMYYGEGPTPEEEIASRSGWDGISAVRNGDIFVASSDEIARPGPRLQDAAAHVAEFVNG